MERQRVTTGTEWEPKVGYSRAIRAGDQVHVAGTTATDGDGEIIEGGPYEQTVRALEIVADALEEVGSGLDDVVRTRLYVTDVDDWEAIGRAHGEFFGEVRPAASMVEVARLIDPEARVEIEATAVVDEADDPA